MMQKRMAWLLAVVLLLCAYTGSLAEDAAGVVWQDGQVHGSLEQIDDAGNRLYRFSVEQGAAYADGTPMSAYDFVCALLLRSSSEWAALKPEETATGSAGEANPGVRLISEDTFELSIAPDYELPQDLEPCPPEELGLEVRDDGQGAYLVGDLEKGIVWLLGGSQEVELPELPVPLGFGEEDEGETQKDETPAAQPEKTKAPEAASTPTPATEKQTAEPEATQAPVAEANDAQTPLVSVEEPDENTAEEVLAEEEGLTEEAVEEEAAEEEAAIFRSISIKLHESASTFQYGDTVTLEAVLTGYDNAPYTLQWEYSPNGKDGWRIAAGNCHASIYQYQVNENNASGYWRVAVEIPE